MAVAAAISCALGALAPTAGATPSAVHARIGPALGVVPAQGGPDIAVGSNLPEAYHGGPVMHGVTVHTIFWAPSGYRFDGSPSPGVLGYEPMVQRFFSDTAQASGQTSNVYSVQREYGDGAGPGSYAIAYSPAADSIDVTDPYPPASQQCPSPNGITTCVTDLELQEEIDHVIQTRDPTARGSTNLWFIFLPPNVDTCVSPGSCGSNAYGGYHSLSNLDHGVTIYAVIPDPLIEAPFPPGADPQGNTDAEAAIGAAAHETVEAVSDPQGTGWMDPNGNEAADKCEFGPDVGTPLGYAANGSPYNQLIGGDEWLIQDMWSNASGGCVQSSSATIPPPSLPEVNLTQFSPAVSGSIGAARAKVKVTIMLRRAGTFVARARTTTRADGSWGPVSLTSLTLAPVAAVGDDRDKVYVAYGTGGPPTDTILTGNGGNAFTETGWTGWFDLDHGYAVFSAFGVNGVLIAPCFQTGVLSLTINRAATESPTELCGTETDISIISTGTIGDGADLRLQSADNRAVTPANPNGALVNLRVPLGEANSLPSIANNQIFFEPSGFPTCTANLRSQRVTCSGLVPGARYTLTRRRGHASAHARAGGGGSTPAVSFGGTRPLAGGDVVVLSNDAHRTLTALHVAQLRVNLIGAQTVVASGTCEAGAYYGPAPASPPINAAVGAPGIAGTGKICPPDGRAKGLPAARIEQTDDRSGGETVTSVPQLEFTSPSNGATLYGRFVALAGAGIPTPQHAVIASAAAVSVTISPASGGRPVFRAANVNTSGGVHVDALAPGAYAAKWVVRDANGDTRTVQTRFVEAA
ncbi:MAG TPA: hypothetical protein VG388_05495 [Solirubrobacteraceae bacterium]|nr:hypothetical protein [Solirubrobacteraceae bacterium]